jgi:uridine kinase
MIQYSAPTLQAFTEFYKAEIDPRADTLLKATLVSWDDFDDISRGPEDYIDWYKRGEDYSEWDYPALAEALKSLKNGQSIQHPIFKE